MLAYMSAHVKMGTRDDLIEVVQGTSMEHMLGMAVKRVSIERKKTIGYVQGHGEPSLAEMPEVYESLGVLYEVATIPLPDSLSMPDRFAALVIVDPVDSFPEHHLRVLDEMLARDVYKRQIVEIRELIKEVGKAKTVIFSTHILPEVEATCDRILIINKGRIVADGDPRSLRQRSEGQHVLRVRIPAADPAYVSPILSGLPGVEHVDAIGEGVFILQSSSADTAAEVYQLCSRSGWLLTELSPLEARLEEVFRNLTLN